MENIELIDIWKAQNAKIEKIISDKWIASERSH